jgi:hypothetical protein
LLATGKVAAFRPIIANDHEFVFAYLQRPGNIQTEGDKTAVVLANERTTHEHFATLVYRPEMEQGALAHIFRGNRKVSSVREPFINAKEKAFRHPGIQRFGREGDKDILIFIAYLPVLFLLLELPNPV